MENSNSTEERAALVAGLHALADFLVAHPEIDFPLRLSCSSHFGGVDEETAIARIEAWKALGFKDEWDFMPTNPGHHGVHVKFGAFELHLSYVEKEHSRPIAWGDTKGESDKEFQARINAALEAVAQ